MSEPVVIDTCVVLSAFISRSSASPPKQIVKLALAGSLEFLLSAELIHEYRTVLQRKLCVPRYGVSPEQVAAAVIDMASRGTVLQQVASAPEGPDPRDVHLWRLLRARPEATLITGDKALISQAPAWARVTSPAAWLAQHELTE